MRKFVSVLAVIIFINSVLIGQIEKANELPVANIEISPVSKTSFTAPVWLKFYPVNTYDPDGTIVLFKMDVNGDGVFDVVEESLSGSSYQFTRPGEYTATVHVTDNDGGITIKSHKFVITEFDEVVDEGLFEDIEIEEYDETEVPEVTWEETDIPWVNVWNPSGDKVIAKEVDSTQVPNTGFRNITPIISIEPKEEGSAIGAVRVELPNDLNLSREDKERVVMAFYEESLSVSTGETTSQWRMHTLDYDEETDTYFAEMNHGCVIVMGLPIIKVVGIPLVSAGLTCLAWDDAKRLLLSKKASTNFVLHYNKTEISETKAKETLDKLEKAKTFLTKDISAGGLGLRYPRVPAKVDVYYMDIKSEETIYGLYHEGKTGGKWIDLNLPSNIKYYDQNKLEATIVHELFHIVQYSNYNNSDYSWINEALSTGVEMSFVKAKKYIPDQKNPILNNDLYKKGLHGLTSASDGYSVGIFINYLSYRFGLGIFSTILDESKRQIIGGQKASPIKVLQRAITRLARKQAPDKRQWSNLDFIWKDFTNTFLREKTDPAYIDKRLNCKMPFTNKAYNLTVGEKQKTEQWVVHIPSLSLKPLASRIYNIKPSKWNDEDKAILDCDISFSPQDVESFEVITQLSFANEKGKMAILPSQTRSIGTLSKNKNNQSFSLELKKKQRFNLLSIIPIGFGADKGPGIAQVAYTLSCQLRKEEDIEIGQNVPISTSANDAYWWAYWQTAVQIKGSAGNKLDILNASPLDDMSRTAHAEWKPIKQEIRQVDEEMEHYTELLEPITSIAYEYQNLRNEYADSINALIINKKITPNEYKEAARILESKKLSSAQSLST